MLTPEHRAVGATVKSSMHCILVQERNSPNCSVTTARLNEEMKEQNNHYMTKIINTYPDVSRPSSI
jgi:hypothetical protein